jgi:hypothetical protein
VLLSGPYAVSTAVRCHAHCAWRPSCTSTGRHRRRGSSGLQGAQLVHYLGGGLGEVRAGAGEHGPRAAGRMPTSGGRDLNPRPPDPQSGALPNCATARACFH